MHALLRTSHMPAAWYYPLQSRPLMSISSMLGICEQLEACDDIAIQHTPHKEWTCAEHTFLLLRLLGFLPPTVEVARRLLAVVVLPAAVEPA